jgi:hypothetical protein
MATLVDSSSNPDYAHIRVLSYTADAAADKFIETVYAISRQQARNRLVIKDGRYMYTPSDDYTTTKETFIRAKFHKL